MWEKRYIMLKRVIRKVFTQIRCLRLRFKDRVKGRINILERRIK